MKKTISAILAIFIILATSIAHSQTSVTTFPLGATVTNGSSSVTLTNQFQSVFASNTSRRACVIQNTGTHIMYVFFGAIGSATTASSYPLFPASSAGFPGGYVACNNGGVVVTDQVSITGTTGDTFTATAQ